MYRQMHLWKRKFYILGVMWIRVKSTYSMVRLSEKESQICYLQVFWYFVIFSTLLSYNFLACKTGIVVRSWKVKILACARSLIKAIHLIFQLTLVLPSENRNGQFYRICFLSFPNLRGKRFEAQHFHSVEFHNYWDKLLILSLQILWHGTKSTYQNTTKYLCLPVCRSKCSVV